MAIGQLSKTLIVGLIIILGTVYGINQLGTTQNLVTVDSNSSAIVNFSVAPISDFIGAGVGLIVGLITLYSWVNGWLESRRWRNVVIKAKNFCFYRNN
jgi:hypothetical protein